MCHLRPEPEEIPDADHELVIERITVESTSDYWRIRYYMLEAAGLSVQLVNALDVKNVPGRSKTAPITAATARVDVVTGQ